MEKMAFIHLHSLLDEARKWVEEKEGESFDIEEYADDCVDPYDISASKRDQREAVQKLAREFGETLRNRYEIDTDDRPDFYIDSSFEDGEYENEILESLLEAGGTASSYTEIKDETGLDYQEVRDSVQSLEERSLVDTEKKGNRVVVRLDYGSDHVRERGS